MKRFPYASYAFGPSHADAGGRGQTIYFQDNFETDDVDLVPIWDARGGGGAANATLNTNPTYAHGGTQSGSFRYQIAAGGSPSQDSNCWVSKIIYGVPSTFHIRGYLYLKTPEVGMDTFAVQRKLIWFSNSTNPTDNVQNPSFQDILDLWSDPPGLNLSLAIQSTPAGDPPSDAKYNLGALAWDAWNCIEMRTELNTPSVSDGVVTVWVGGVQTSRTTGLNLRGSFTDNATFFSIGEQTNRTHSEQIDEYRFWDDVVIASSYIGP